MEFFFSQNTPCELTLPGAHFERGLTLQLGNEVPFDSRVILQAIKFPKLQTITGSPDV